MLRETSIYYEQWAKEFGSVYRIPSMMGTKQTILLDPKAVAHYYAHEAYTYRMQYFQRQGVRDFVRCNVISKID